MEFTGERYVPGVKGAIELEHMHRYRLAASLVSGMHVLDIACGEGYGSNILAGTARSVVGVDIDGASIDHAYATYGRPGVEFIVSDCSSLPLSDARFDAAVSFETIEHVSNQAEMLDEIVRVLRPGGLLVMSSPNKLVYADLADHHNPFHVRELYLEEFRTLLVERFVNVAIYGQRVELLSTIQPIAQRPGEARLDRGLPSEPQRFFTYFVALCSNEALPQCPTAIGGIEGEDVFAMTTARIAKAERELLALEDAYQKLEREFLSIRREPKAAIDSAPLLRSSILDDLATLNDRMAACSRERESAAHTRSGNRA